MKRGNTYPQLVTIAGVDLTAASEVVLTVKPLGRPPIEFTGESMSISADSSGTTIAYKLSEEQSLSLGTGYRIDVNWMMDGNRGGTSIKMMPVSQTLLNRVIGGGSDTPDPEATEPDPVELTTEQVRVLNAISPKVTDITHDDEHLRTVVTVNDVLGDHEINIPDGPQGFSPLARAVQTNTGAYIEVTDQRGTTAVILHNGGTLTVEEMNAIASNAVTRSHNRMMSVDSLAQGNAIEILGVPEYVSDVSQYSAYGITDTGWYSFLHIFAPTGVKTDATTTITGAAGYIIEQNKNYVDVAICFEVAATSKRITVLWNSEAGSEDFVFKATDLAVRNLDYRTTFYVYDIARYTTWQYALTADATFVADKKYYTTDGETYTLAIAGTDYTVGEAVPADTYYNHSKVIFSGMERNVTYQCNETIDCPQEYILPEIEDDTHGAWFEIRLRHSGSFSSTLTVPEGVKVATEHTQAETAGMNMVDLHYSNVDGVKIWRFLNTHSTIPA